MKIGNFVQTINNLHNLNSRWHYFTKYTVKHERLCSYRAIHSL